MCGAQCEDSRSQKQGNLCKKKLFCLFSPFLLARLFRIIARSIFEGWEHGYEGELALACDKSKSI